MTHLRTLKERDKLTSQVQSDFRDLIAKYCRHDAREMIARQTEEMNEGATIGGRPVPRAKSNNDVYVGDKVRERKERKRVEDQR